MILYFLFCFMQHGTLLQVTMQLKSPPKWLRRPCGASFGFGGKLVSFENISQTLTNNQGQPVAQHKPQVGCLVIKR